LAFNETSVSMHQFGKALVAFLVLLVSLQNLHAQEQDKAQSQQYFDLAKEMITATRAVDDARDLMVIAANFDTTNLNANFEAGYMYITTINKDLAEKYFNRVYRQKPSYRFDLEYWIGLSYQYGLQFDKALDFYGRYKTKLERTSTNYSGKDKVPAKQVDRRIEECNNGKELVGLPKSFSIINLGSEVNSEYDDYAPVVDSSETEIVFTTRRRDGNINENVWDDNKPYEDIFVSKKVNGKWEQAKNIGTSINTRFNNSNLTLSPDGNTLFIYKDGIGEGDIFFSERLPDGIWTTPKPLPGTINSPFRESSVSMTKDESTIYFASERPGGLGVSDIYSAKKNAKGAWSVIKNLGPAINTEYEEDSPYMDYDGKTLYFSSMGRKGMGGRDLFKATLLDAEINEWSEPENLGYPINTPDDDVFITGTSTPNRFYFASERAGGFGYSDIYLVTDVKQEAPPVVTSEPVKKNNHPHKFILTVLDAETKKPMKANVRMRGVDNSSVGSISVSEGVNEFVILSPVAKNYIVYVEMDGYIFENIELSLGGASENDITDEKTILLRKIKTGEVSVLRHVFFDTGKSTLKPESFDELDKFVRMMEQNMKVRVEIGGHTDDVGAHDFNIKLSQQRAAAVKNYLSSKGIEAKRVTSVGYGETRPIVSNDDEEGGRAINRRVEFKVLQN
jgi:outer membrane protein OmpA-like peptidoglycan-associated protein/tetratricopeptide (TPR) repeat protein